MNTNTSPRSPLALIKERYEAWRVYKRALKLKHKRFVCELVGNPKYSRQGLNGLDYKLEKYLNFKGGFFIEAGANDGFTQSNTYYLEKIMGWRGVLVEAVPELYEKCRKVRKKAHVFNCALVARDYAEPTVDMHFANLMSVIDGSLKNPEKQTKHINEAIGFGQISESYLIKVKARTLGSILDELPQLPRIDFLSLDVEGYELNVLDGLDLGKHSPRYILIECNFFDDVNNILKDRYDLVEKMTHHDYLFRAKN